MTIASAGFAASLGACYGAPRSYQPPENPPPRPPPEMIAVEGNAVDACDRVIDQAEKNGCEVHKQGGGLAQIFCKDLRVNIRPGKTESGGPAVEIQCGEPYDTCRSSVEKMISPTPPVEPIPPPP
jgi:hypothetical protein